MAQYGRRPDGDPLRHLLYTGAVVAVVIALGTVGYVLVEGWSAFDALYMTVTTVTTVGYHEVNPLSPAGRAFTTILILTGVGTLFYVVGNFARFALVSYILAVEELSKVCGSTGLTLAAQVSLGTYPIYAWGGKHLREEYGPRLIRGEYMGAYGLTEPGAGSDAGSTRTTAVRDGDAWLLNGRKCFCTNASYAGTFLVTAVTEPGLGARGISAFVVPRGIEGFFLEPGEKKLGMRGSDWGSLVFQDARIPADHLLGRPGEGFKTFMKTLDGGRIS